MEGNRDDPCLCMNLKGHKKAITDLTFNSKRNEFASSSEDHSIMIWHGSENIRSYNFSGHTGPVTALEYSPNGKLLASSSTDQTVRLWVPTIRGGSSEFKPHTSAVRTVSFAPDGRQIVTGSNDKSIKLWDTHTQQFIMSFLGHNNWVRSAKFTEDGSLLVSCADDRSIRIWDPRTGGVVNVFNIVKSSALCISLHRNNNTIAAAINSGSVRLYDIKEQKLQQHYQLHKETNSVDWHPTANFLLSSGSEGKLVIIDVMEGRPLYTLRGHEGGITTAKFSKDGLYFVSGGTDRHIMLWRTNFI